MTNKAKKISLGKKMSRFSAGKKKPVERRRESTERSSNFSLLSTELGSSIFVDPRTKVHLRDESYAWVPKTMDFTKDSHEEFGRTWVLSLRDFRKLCLHSKR